MNTQPELFSTATVPAPVPIPAPTPAPAQIPPAPPTNPLLLRYTPAEIAAKTGMIRDMLARVSSHYTHPDFTSLPPEDLRFVFGMYDAIFFQHWFKQTVAEKSGMPIVFRLSPTMTSAGGKTITRRRRNRFGMARPEFEIAVSGHLLFTNFRDPAESVSVGGLHCPDRISALQRIMEHEIIHLLELLACGESSCAKPQFKALIANIFGHTESRHNLVTPRQRAAIHHAIHVGSIVEFQSAGITQRGRVNRITSRATVLVNSPDGQLYTDGGRYLKFYVPLQCMRAVGTDQP